MSKNRVIGRANQLPWNLPEDLRRFRALTSHKPIIMGRKTFESIGKPLPNRVNIVITRQQNYAPPGIIAVHSLDAAFEEASRRTEGEVFVMGGAEIYVQALHRADRIYLTLIDENVEGDAYFPEFDEAQYELKSKETRHEPRQYSFLNFERKT